MTGRDHVGLASPTMRKTRSGLLLTILNRIARQDDAPYLKLAATTKSTLPRRYPFPNVYALWQHRSREWSLSRMLSGLGSSLCRGTERYATTTAGPCHQLPKYNAKEIAIVLSRRTWHPTLQRIHGR